MSYQVYHNNYSSAINAAQLDIEERGFTFDENEVWTMIGCGPRRPKDDETNQFSLTLFKNSKQQKKMYHIQITGIGTKFELNSYIN